MWFRKNKLFLILLSCVFILLFSESAFAAQIKDIQIFPQVGIPGTEIQPGKPFTISNESLANYIIAIYKWSVTAIAALAVVMIMIAGFRWMTSAGNASMVTQAKDQMFSALIGLILIIGAYTILNFVNPALVRFKDLTIKSVGRVGLGSAIKVHVCDSNSPVFVSATAQDGKWIRVPKCGEEVGWVGLDGKPHKCMGVETETGKVCNIVFGIKDEHRQRVINGEDTSENTYDSKDVYEVDLNGPEIHVSGTETANLGSTNLTAPFACGSSATSIVGNVVSYGSCCGVSVSSCPESLCSYFAYTDVKEVSGQCNRGMAVGFLHCDIGETRMPCYTLGCPTCNPVCTSNDAVKETDAICCQKKDLTGYYCKSKS